MEKWKKSEFQNTCVKIEHVTKRFGEDLVLKEVNLTLKVGQVYGVVGNNGSGKIGRITLDWVPEEGK